MMTQYLPVTINFTGGIISPGALKDILDIAAQVLVNDLRFGLRQQLMMNVPSKKYQDFERKCSEKKIIFYGAETAVPNIVSSYCSAGIFTTDSWLGEGVYKDVFDLFNYQPKLKINICDSRQHLVPFFSGHLNWLSSSHSHFWHLGLRLPGSDQVYLAPVLVYTNDVAKVSKAIEHILLETDPLPTGDELIRLVNERITYISRPLSAPLSLPAFHLPYYEGFNKEGETCWLGIYRRDQLFQVDFLKDLCDICLETKLGQFYTTSWKSIIIKGIHENHRSLWDQMLGMHRINVRHAANELNWQVEDNNDDGLVIKRHVIRHFDVEDVRTYGLNFVVKTRSSPGMFGSVIISKQRTRNNSRLKSLDRYEILYTRNFNPNSTDLISFRKDVEKDQLGTYLVSLCKFYYEQLKTGSAINSARPAVAGLDATPSKSLYQCVDCLSVYDESIGEADNHIPAGTSFSNLLPDYACPLCEAGKENFVEIPASSLILDSVSE